MAIDNVQLISLANMLRRKLKGLTFTVYDYDNKKDNVGNGTIIDDSVILTDISDFNANSITERYNNLISMTLELDSASFI